MSSWSRRRSRSVSFRDVFLKCQIFQRTVLVPKLTLCGALFVQLFSFVVNSAQNILNTIKMRYTPCSTYQNTIYGRTIDSLESFHRFTDYSQYKSTEFPRLFKTYGFSLQQLANTVRPRLMNHSRNLHIESKVSFEMTETLDRNSAEEKKLRIHIHKLTPVIFLFGNKHRMPTAAASHSRTFAR